MNLMSTAIIADQLTVGHWTHDSLARLAGTYREAALALLDDARYRKQNSSGPARLLALHAIELYLSALLLARGHEAASIRALQHDLSARHAMAIEKGLVLRRCTGRHLQVLARNREYLVTRYHPEAAASLSEVTRLRATLEEIAVKVTLGGILRDLLANEPSVLMRKEIYISAAMAGAATFVIVDAFGAAPMASMGAGFVIALVVRSGALSFGWNLPTYRSRPGRKADDL